MQKFLGIHAETNNEPRRACCTSPCNSHDVAYCRIYFTIHYCQWQRARRFWKCLECLATDCAANYVSMTVTLIVYTGEVRERERERERERRKEPATSHRIRVSDPWTRPERSAINNTCFSIQPRDKEY